MGIYDQIASGVYNKFAGQAGVPTYADASGNTNYLIGGQWVSTGGDTFGSSGDGEYSSGVLGATSNPSPATTSTAPPPAAPVDPYAEVGGQSTWNDMLNDPYNSAQTEANQYGRTYGVGYNNLGTSYGSGLADIDDRNINNVMGRNQARSGILDMVGTGIRSGNVMLSNRNAADSSASEAIARAYGEIGSDQAAEVGQQFATEQMNIKKDKNKFLTEIEQAELAQEAKMKNTIDTIVEAAGTELRNLDSMAVDASLPDRIDIETKKAEIRKMVSDRLKQEEQKYLATKGGFQSMDPNQVRTEALRRTEQGQKAAGNIFQGGVAPSVNYSGQSGSSGLPIYTYGSQRKKEI